MKLDQHIIQVFIMLLRVLSKLVSTGTRLADSIFRSHEDYKCRKQKDGNRNT